MMSILTFVLLEQGTFALRCWATQPMPKAPFPRALFPIQPIMGCIGLLVFPAQAFHDVHTPPGICGRWNFCTLFLGHSALGPRRPRALFPIQPRMVCIELLVFLSQASHDDHTPCAGSGTHYFCMIFRGHSACDSGNPLFKHAFPSKQEWAVSDCLCFFCMPLILSIHNFMSFGLGDFALRFSCHSALGLRYPFPERGSSSNQDQPRMGCIVFLVPPTQDSHDEHTRLLAEEHRTFALRVWASPPLAQETHS